MSEKSETSSENSDKITGRKMNALAEARSYIIDASGASGGVKERIRRASRVFDAISFNRVRDIFYADSRVRISAEEIEYLRLVARQRRAKEREKEAQNEYADLAERVRRLEALAQRAPDVDRAAAHAKRESARVPDRSMDC